MSKDHSGKPFEELFETKKFRNGNYKYMGDIHSGHDPQLDR